MSRAWQGIVGRGMTAAQFDAYVTELPMSTWRPRFCVVHNTGVPEFSAWHRVPGPTRMAALERYYRDDQKWSAGPHVFVADDLIWPFTPLYTPGVHAPSWNQIAWGVEFVGDFNSEQVPTALFGNGISALATLHRKAELDPAKIRLHREDPLTTHKVCPGDHLSKTAVIANVQGALGQPMQIVDHPLPTLRTLSVGSRGSDVESLQHLLAMQNLGTGLGVFGPLTKSAVVRFQTAHNLTADGVVGPSTWRALIV
jgi:hypothetical protein